MTEFSRAEQTLPEVASLHESTVKDHHLHLPKRTRKAPVRKAGKVVRRKVHPDVWKKALRLAGGDVSRLVVRDFDTVTILNPREA